MARIFPPKIRWRGGAKIKWRGAAMARKYLPKKRRGGAKISKVAHIEVARTKKLARALHCE